jgi:S-adenosylmethionine:tRNA ribosyltransferase-isomerase
LVDTEKCQRLGFQRVNRYTCLVRVVDFDYSLPPELIAQSPAARRDQSRLLVLSRADGRMAHRSFRDLVDYLRSGDVLVLNNSRVIPARLRGTKAGSGGQIEVLLLEENAVNDWWVLLRPGKRVRPDTIIWFLNHRGERTEINARVLEKGPEGRCRLLFSGSENIAGILDSHGEVPLPPYITREMPAVDVDDRERYQTVYAVPPGSVAAPTAGLHFTRKLLEEVRLRGADVRFLTLHVGLGTFGPVKTGNLEEHVMHEERFELSATTAETINEAKRTNRRIIAVGTTSLRVLESVAAANQGQLVECCGRTRLFIYPPCYFKVADALITNFHLPQTTLLMLVSAFAAPGQTRGRGLILSAYAEAIRERYRFYSFGDAMLIL